MSRTITLITLIFLLASNFASAVTGEFFDYNGYMRAGTGNNSKGGGLTCFNNPDAGGNLFRVGNECDIFSENILVAKFQKDKSDQDKFFKSQIRFIYKNDNADKDWSQVQDDQDNGSQMLFREVFFQGGRFNDSKVTYWAGKRLYREQDIWMNDQWFFDIDGFGGGVEDIAIGDATLNLAYFRKNNTDTNTDIGYTGINHYDLRIRNIKAPSLGEFLAWGGYAKTHDSKNTTTLAEYEGYSGYVAGLLNKNNFQDGFNHMFLIYSTGLLQGQNLNGEVLLTKGSEDLKKAKEASRLTLADHVMYKLSSNLDFNMAIEYERRDNGASKDNMTNVYSLGMTSIYSFTDNYQLLFQAGHSVVDPDVVDKRTMTRFTVAPQVSPGGFWGRPLVRVFYAKTFWNNANRGLVNSGPYATTTSGANMGIQGEVWF